jgi:hypothetical protein
VSASHLTDDDLLRYVFERESVREEDAVIIACHITACTRCADIDAQLRSAANVLRDDEPWEIVDADPRRSAELGDRQQSIERETAEAEKLLARF